MDHFGIGPAIKGAARVYMQSARRTGRTQSLIESLKDGDRVVFLTKNHADYFKSRCREHGVEVECIVSPVEKPDRILERGVAKGRTIFDHCWVESFYEHHIERGMRLLEFLTKSTSRTKEIEEPERAYHERVKWS